MAIWDRAWMRTRQAAEPITAVPATPKSREQIESLRLPLEELGRIKELRYPASGSNERMYDAGGVEMRACTVKIDRHGRGHITYEDGEQGSVQIEWISGA